MQVEKNKGAAVIPDWQPPANNYLTIPKSHCYFTSTFCVWLLPCASNNVKK
jgi:hypothetical protein